VGPETKASRIIAKRRGLHGRTWRQTHGEGTKSGGGAKKNGDATSMKWGVYDDILSVPRGDGNVCIGVWVATIPRN